MFRELAAACVASACVVGGVGPALADGVPTVPSPPVDVIATSSWDFSVLNITWLPSLEDGGADVQWYEATVSPGSKSCRVQARTELMRCSVNGLRLNRAYTVTVTAESVFGLSAPSAPSEPVMMWAPPRIVSVKTGSRKARVRWTSATDPSVTNFRVTQVGGNRTCSASADKRSCVVRGLKNGRAYRFQVSLQSGPKALVTSKPSKVVTPRRIKK
jgi:hypothetical protein